MEQQHLVDLDLAGRTAKAHIDKWEQYGRKAEEHKISATQILVTVRPKVGSYGQWGRWLHQYGIARRTADRLLYEARNPEKADERREDNRERERRTRAAARQQSATCGSDSQAAESRRRRTDYTNWRPSTAPQKPIDINTLIGAIISLGEHLIKQPDPHPDDFARRIVEAVERSPRREEQLRGLTMLITTLTRLKAFMTDAMTEGEAA